MVSNGERFDICCEDSFHQSSVQSSATGNTSSSSACCNKMDHMAECRNHLPDNKKVFSLLSPEDVATIKSSISACERKKLQSGLLFIDTYLGTLLDTINKLET